MSDLLATCLAYHEATKHHLDRYAAGPGYLDWDTQPDPFRRYAGAPLIPLEHAPPGPEPPYAAVFAEGALPPRPVDRAALSRLFYDSLALSAWKVAGGARWALRVNPSSGNLHPTEGYLVCGPETGIEGGGVFHYAPAAHALELRHRIAPDAWAALAAALPPGAVLVGLASIHWREAWKYGERAFRYCQHDAGHALAAVALAAGALGWDARLLDDLGDGQVAALLGLGPADGAEAEHPDGLLAVFPHGGACASLGLPDSGLRAAVAGPWLGDPNPLGPAHPNWAAVDRVAAATEKPPTPGRCAPPAPAPPVSAHAAPDIGFRPLAHQRRSAVAMDGVTGMTAETFYRMLERTLPGPGRRPFGTLPWAPAIHLGLFVHRVHGLTPGIYLLARDPAALPRLRETLAEPAFLWQPPAGCPEGLALFTLIEEDVTRMAGVLSCRQAIAAQGAFSLGMLAEFRPRLEAEGAWMYRRLFWEAGAVGQVLYLEAEAAALRATGIGCYFDDPVHTAFGITGDALQSLYHFTVGGAVDDPRLASEPPYG